MARGTTKRNIRISDELWQAALKGTAERGSNVAEYIRGVLEREFGEGADLDAIIDDDPLMPNMVRIQPHVNELPQQSGKLTTPQKLKQLRKQLATEESAIARNAIQKQIELLELMS